MPNGLTDDLNSSNHRRPGEERPEEMTLWIRRGDIPQSGQRLRQYERAAAFPQAK